MADMEKQIIRRRSSPRPSARGPRPHVWRCGPDQLTHDQYNAWLKHRAQAAFRGEPHELSFEQWQALWNKDNAWFQRGRSGPSLCLTRIDHQRPWSLSNCVIINRIEQMKIHNAKNLGKKYKVK